MILTCPACATRYRVAEEEFAGSAGRTVRCANCGHIWFTTGSAGQPAAAGRQSVGETGASFDGAISERRGEPEFSPSRLAASPHPRPAAPRRGRATALWIVGIAVILLAVVVAATVLRREFPADWVPGMRLHAATGQSAEAGETGLAIRGVARVRAGDGLIIEGEIANRGSSPRDVPRLRLALQDAAQQEVRSKIVDPPKRRLQPGEVAHFEIPFAHPPDAATGVVVTFASP